jgi:sugar phosphate isomerase/epimerase
MVDILLSGFADEAAADKTIDQQFSTMAALGLRYLSIRFVDTGNGVQNVLELSDDDLRRISKRLADYGLEIASIGSPVGKVRIVDLDDGTGNRYVPFDDYLQTEVAAAIRAAEALQTRLIRGFSFYHPRNTDPAACLPQAVDQLGQIVDLCDRHGLTFGLEVEANLIGHSGSLLQQIHQQISHPGLVLVFDGANLVTQGYTSLQIMEQFREMLPGLGWMHVKDYRAASGETAAPGRYVDEEALSRYVPCDRGSAGHAEIFQALLPHLPGLTQRLARRGIPGFFLDLEPHLRGGGQFGGFSGPDGMGIALRSLLQVLDHSGIRYQLKSFEELPK